MSTLSRNAADISGLKLTKTNKVWSEDTVSVALTSMIKEAATCGDGKYREEKGLLEGTGG